MMCSFFLFKQIRQPMLRGHPEEHSRAPRPPEPGVMPGHGLSPTSHSWGLTQIGDSVCDLAGKYVKAEIGARVTKAQRFCVIKYFK